MVMMIRKTLTHEKVDEMDGVKQTEKDKEAIEKMIVVVIN